MNRCAEIKSELVGFLDDELSPADRAEVDLHLGTCRGCAEELAVLERLKGAVSEALAVRRVWGLAGDFAVVEARILQEELAVEQGTGSTTSARVASRSRWRRGAAASRSGATGRLMPWRVVAWGGLAAAGLALLVNPGWHSLLQREDRPTTKAQQPSRRAAEPETGERAVEPDRHGNEPGQRGGGRVATRASREARNEPRSPTSLAADAPEPPEGAPVADGSEGVPDELRRQPGLYLDLPIVKRLDKLRHLEAVHRDSDAQAGSAG